MFWIGRNPQSQLYHQQNKRGFICSLSSVRQKCMLNAAVLPWEIWNCVVRNMKRLLAANPCCELAEIQWTNRVCMSGQIGWAPRSALAATKSDLPKFWQCPGLVHVPQNPIMYDIWFVWSETSYSIDERRCYRCGTNNERPNSEDRATQPMDVGGWVSQLEDFQSQK